MFCNMKGALNPGTPQGESRLREAAKEMNETYSLTKLKTFLNSLFERAVSNRDATVPDARGGKQTSVADCLGIPVVPLPPSSRKIYSL